MNIGVHVFFFKLMFSLFPNVCLTGELLYLQQFQFQFFEELPIVLHSVCTSLHSHQQLKGLLSQHLFQHLLFIEFLMIIILTGVRWDFIIVLIYITLMISDVEYVFIHLLVIHISSFLKNVYLGLLPMLESGCLF